VPDIYGPPGDTCVTIAPFTLPRRITNHLAGMLSEQNKMHNPFMARAIQASLENIRSGVGGPFAAVVVKDGKIIAEGTNRVTSTNDPTAHAEVVAIREACKKLGHFELTNCEIYTTCEPCPMCLGAIYWARPARVYYACTAADASEAGFDDAFIYQELIRPHSERKIPMIPTMREEALQAFRVWEGKQDKIKY
jgi:guanine deaminase